MIVYQLSMISVNAGKFIYGWPLPKLELRVEVDRNEIQSCIWALVITNWKERQQGFSQRVCAHQLAVSRLMVI